MKTRNNAEQASYLDGRAGSPQPAAARWGHRALPWLVSLSFLAVCLSAQSQTYSIDWYKIAGGGGTSTGSVYSASGTVGQPDASGAMTGGNYSLTGGFWSLIAVVQTPGAPLLTITLNPQLSTINVSWPNTGSYTLQQNPDLVNGSWATSSYTITTSNGTNSVTVTPPTGNLFFRLHNP